MKIKYEDTVKDCQDYCIFFRQWCCLVDSQYIIGKITDKNITLPCEIRPCPLEVKE